jgi:DNA invertase Pin-like site-specific DNA recombinase/DNA-binding CsgD family transcriptional regulator
MLTGARDSKVSAGHLGRQAYLYVRQSTLRQVVENTESTARQYELSRRAVALGWAEEQVVVIDSDLGQSGASAADRAGFQRLVSEVGLGRAGIVMGLEVSRLARNSSDWHRLLEICALRATLILDEDGLYDPSDFNDRLLLGLKGTMSEAELHMIRARLQGGIRNKARRGELRFRLPVGFVYDGEGKVALDPDEQVRQSVLLLFSTFRRVGSAFGTARAFGEEGLVFPTRLHSGPCKGEVVWGPLTMSRVAGVLHNPRYAGAYTYGRRGGWHEGPDGLARMRSRPREAWHTLIVDAHPGYITWKEYEENLERLRENARDTPENRRCAPREGPALLQGVVVCGICGRRMTVRYQGGKEKPQPWYQCHGARDLGSLPTCQSLPGRGIDRAVGELLLEAVTPVALEVALAVEAELEARVGEAEALRLKQVERARYEAELARRRFFAVDPEHRLVADSLEAEWNEKLREWKQVREDYERHRQEDRWVLDEESKARIRQLATDFPRLWRNPRTQDRERKRMVRLLIEDVTLLRTEEEMVAQVRFRGGAPRTLKLPRPLSAGKLWKLSQEALAEMDRLLDHHTEREVAEILNERRFRTGTGKSFNASRVKGMRRAYGLATRQERLQAAGLLTLDEIAARLGHHKETVKRLRREGRLPVLCHRVDDGNRFMYEDPDVHAKPVGPVPISACAEEVQYE